METLFEILAGLGLSAACGFRVFLPVLVAGLAERFAHLPLAVPWLGSTSALVLLGVAALLEVAAYYVPRLDRVVDSIATPGAILAGILLTGISFAPGAAVALGGGLGWLVPFGKWTFAVLAGGTLAAAFKGLAALARQVSLLSTGGLGNPLLATAESCVATVLAAVAVTVPGAAVVLVAALLLVAVKLLVPRSGAVRPT